MEDTFSVSHWVGIYYVHECGKSQMNKFPLVDRMLKITIFYTERHKTITNIKWLPDWNVFEPSVIIDLTHTPLNNILIAVNKNYKYLYFHVYITVWRQLIIYVRITSRTARFIAKRKITLRRPISEKNKINTR